MARQSAGSMSHPLPCKGGPSVRDFKTLGWERDECGSALVEFALSVTILITLMFRQPDNHVFGALFVPLYFRYCAGRVALRGRSRIELQHLWQPHLRLSAGNIERASDLCARPELPRHHIEQSDGGNDLVFQWNDLDVKPWGQQRPGRFGQSTCELPVSAVDSFCAGQYSDHDQHLSGDDCRLNWNAAISIALRRF